MKAIPIFVLAIIIASCHREQAKPTCSTPATVVDLQPHGCTGLGFKLTDGTLLLPMTSFCGTGNIHNPLANFQMALGQEVVIGYDDVGGAPCGMVAGARITCITLVESDEK